MKREYFNTIHLNKPIHVCVYRSTRISFVCVCDLNKLILCVYVCGGVLCVCVCQCSSAVVCWVSVGLECGVDELAIE